MDLAGADDLYGRGGADQLCGGRGADQLFGVFGVDVSTGSPGGDQFSFSAAGEGPARITDFGAGDTLELTGALAGAAVRMVDDGTSTTVKVRTAAADGFTDLAVLEGHRAPIDVWYGDQQQFGAPGAAPRWVNILGTVATDDLEALSYSLNGGPEQALALGPNTTRLHEPGDFNIELDYGQLDGSATDDLVEITAEYGDGGVFTRAVTLDYEGGQSWPTSYSIDWAKVSDLQDVVQVVDGLWAYDASGVRPAVQGYDRVLALGDASWDSYRLELSIAMHDLHTVDPRGRDGGGILLGLQWNGHTSDPSGGSPHVGWIPSGAFRFNGVDVFLHPTEWSADRNSDGIIDKNLVERQPLPLQEGHTYDFVIESQRLAADTDASDGTDRVYSLKVWEQGDPEPANFQVHQIMADQVPRGGIYLNAHYFDVTFGDLSVTPLPPSDEVLTADNSLVALLVLVLGLIAYRLSRPLPAPAVAAGGPTSASEAVAAGSDLTDLAASGDDAAAAG